MILLHSNSIKARLIRRGEENGVFSRLFLLARRQSFFVVLRPRATAPALVRALLPLLEGDLQLTVGIRQPD